MPEIADKTPLPRPWGAAGAVIACVLAPIPRGVLPSSLSSLGAYPKNP